MGTQRTYRERGDSGQVVPLMAVVLVMMLGLVVVAAEIGTVLDEAARARTAADAAALAGAAEDRASAARIAAANGAELVAFDRHGTDVTVTVKVGRATHQARARAEVQWTLNG